MKQTIAIIVLTVCLVAAGIFAYKFYKQSKEFQSLWENEITLKDDAEKKYNTEKKQYVEDIGALVDKLDKLDKQLKVEKRKVKQVVVVDTSSEYSSSGTATGGGDLIGDKITETVREYYTFSDYHLDITFLTLPGTFQYRLHQNFRIQSYDLGDALQMEMAEVDDAGNVMQTYQLSMRVYQEKNPNKWNFGTNLSVGGGGYVSQTLEGAYSIHALLNFISHGKTHLDSNWRILSVGGGYPGVVVAPVSYRIANFIPLLSDLFIEPLVMMDYGMKFNFGIGISSTL